jgi:hypothetical protein
MAAQATRIESHAGRALTSGEIFEITRARETSLPRLLMLYITTGLGPESIRPRPNSRRGGC